MNYGKSIHGSQQSYALYPPGMSTVLALGGLQAEGVSNFPWEGDEKEGGTP